MEIKAADYDGVQFYLKTTGETFRTVEVSVKSDHVADMMKFGGEVLMKEDFSEYNPKFEGDTLTVKFDCDSLPEKPEDVIRKVSLLKRKLYGAPFDQCFHALKEGESNDLAPICYHYRKDSMMFIKPGNDQIAVVVQLYFEDATDKQLVEIIMREFSEVKSVNQAPSTKYYMDKAPPAALEAAKAMGIKSIPNEKGSFFLQFAFNKNHVKTRAHQDRVTDLVIGLRTYILYHMKCTKAYMLSRMRSKHKSLIQTLNRAKPNLKSKLKGKRREI